MCDISEVVGGRLKMRWQHQDFSQSHDQKVRCFREGSVSESRILLAGVSGQWRSLFSICLPMTSRWLEGKGALSLCVCVCECVWALNLAQKARCVISLNLWGGVRPAACSNRNTVQPAAWNSSKSRALYLDGILFQYQRDLLRKTASRILHTDIAFLALS